jgi:WD40 repeat protein
VSDRFAGIIDRLIANDLKERFSSVEEVWQAMGLPSKPNKTKEIVPQFNFIVHLSSVNCLDIYQNTIVSGSDDKNISFWRLDTGEKIDSLNSHGRCLTAVVFSPDGEILASASNDLLCSSASYRTIKLWNWCDRRLIHTLMGHSRAVKAIAFTPDGKFLASGSWDKTIKFWDLTNKIEVATLQEPLQISSLVISPDGQWLLSGNFDRAARIWRLFEDNQLHPQLAGIFKEHLWSVLKVVFSPDGKIFATA